jgi:hypothetical protein
VEASSIEKVGALSIEQVMADEAFALHGNIPEAHKLAELAINQHTYEKLIRSNADWRARPDFTIDGPAARENFYRCLNKLNHAALCCSGSGARSVAFCLGVIQALASHDVTSPTALQSDDAADDDDLRVSPEGKSHDVSPDKSQIDPKNSLLARFHYLSTVSGGSCIGSWLSCWHSKSDFSIIVRKLTGRPHGAEVESQEISWLRDYINYATPRLGLASADARMVAAISLRNLVLVWLILIPVICLPLILLKIYAAFAVWMAKNDQWVSISVVLLGLLSLIVSQAFTTRHRPARRLPGTNVNFVTFLQRDFLWSITSAILIVAFFCSSAAQDWAWLMARRLDFFGFGESFVSSMALVGMATYATGWIFGLRFQYGLFDFLCWTLSGLVYGGLVGVGASLISSYYYPSLYDPSQIDAWPSLLLIIFGVPWVLLSQLAAEIIFAGLVSYQSDSDADSEWLSRAGDLLLVSAIGWALMAFLVFGGGFVISHLNSLLGGIRWVLATGGATAIATALLGKGSQMLARRTGDDRASATVLAFNIGFAIVGSIFGALTIFGLSAAIDRTLLGGSLIELLTHGKAAPSTILIWLVIGYAISTFLALIASYFVNINRFSLYAFRRNRLIRTYLGASRQDRHPDLLTGFDFEDNIRIFELWPPRRGSGASPRCLFQVINIALDVVSDKRVGWQQRRAQSFTASALHCGSANLGFRKSQEYGNGISLGTAMAISGSAGHSSSPSITQLLTPFNVRLGWWFGNPGDAGKQSYKAEGPKFAARPLLQELLGLSTAGSPYVYLSDGGHFEKFGLYEMVRRRCRFIIVVDAECDPNFALEALGNAVQKIYIDLGIRIRFEGLEALRNRPGKDDGPLDRIPYYAIGSIHYSGSDGFEEGCSDGYLVYIKPAYHGTEGPGIRSYATAHSAFPHESTADQWFTESQFESYRSLGLVITNSMLRDTAVRQRLAGMRGATDQPSQ